MIKISLFLLSLGQSSHTSCLEMFGEELVTISNNGQVLVHGSFEFLVRWANFNLCSGGTIGSYKIRIIVIAGVIIMPQMV